MWQIIKDFYQKKVLPILKTIGRVQAFILLSLFYYLLLPLVAIPYQLAVFLKGREQRKTYWQKTEVESLTLEELKRQF